MVRTISVIQISKQRTSAHLGEPATGLSKRPYVGDEANPTSSPTVLPQPSWWSAGAHLRDFALSVPGTFFPRASVLFASSPRSLPRPLLQRGCVWGECGGFLYWKRCAGANGQVCVLGMCERVTGCCLELHGVRCAQRAGDESPVARMSVSEPLSPSSKPTLSSEAPARGCKLRFPESLVAPEFLLGSANRRRRGS